MILAAVLACKVSKKDRSVTEAMTTDDVDLASRAQYTAIQTVEDYRQHKVFEGRGITLVCQLLHNITVYS